MEHMSNSTPSSAELLPPTIHSSVEDMPEEMLAIYKNSNRTLAELYSRPLSQRHLERSAGAISRTALGGLGGAPKEEPTCALILGAGQMADTPFLDIVRAFDHTTFIEPDIRTTETTLRTLPSKLLGKVSLIGADITGIAAPFANTIDKLAGQHNDYLGFAAAATSAVRELQIEDTQPNLEQKFNFVCSNLLLSRLTEPLYDFLNGRLRNPPYSTRLSSPDNAEAADQPLASAMDNLRRELQKQHIGYLRRLVADKGVVHFADIYTKLYGRGKDFRRRNVLDEKILDVTIGKGFKDLNNQQPKDRWMWPRPVQSSVVIARALIPKTV